MEIKEDVFYNIIKDWQKRNITPYDKGVMIKEYLKEKNISLRELGRQLDISHTTLHTWVSFAKNLKPGQYLELIDAGVSKDDIYKVANVKHKGMNTNPLDIILSRVLYILDKQPPITKETIKRVKEVIKELNVLIELNKKDDITKQK